MEDQNDVHGLNQSEPPAATAPDRERQIRETIAERVRSDSRDKSRLTSGTAVSHLGGDSGTIESALERVAGVAGFEDIKSIKSADGAVYLYSEQYVASKEAERLALGEEVRVRVVQRVRDDSKSKVRLTPLISLGMLIAGAESDKIDSHLSAVLEDERYRDVRLVSNSKGARYLYSEDSMTATYAVVLARAEANDPMGAIVATVREESRIYPRPTRLSMFAAPVYKIDPDDIYRYARAIVGAAEYPDIKLVEASTGVIYLYSDTYLSEAWVKSTVEWEEVGQRENP